VFSFNRCNAQSGSAHPTTLPAVMRYARTSRACYGFSAAECRRRNRETKRSNDRVGVPLCYWLSHCDSVGCRESTFQSRLKSRLEALPFSVLLFLVWLKASSLGSERHSFSPVADALLPEFSPRSTVDIHTLEAERIACTQCYVCKSQIWVTLIQVNREPPPGRSSVAALEST
jgi:hypothetical protein